MPTIYTIGYEGATVEQLVQTLKNLKIEVLADVRELPLSRKKGLSKNSLSEHVSKVGIEYRHMRELGDPKAGRNAARVGDYAKFERIFNHHFSSAASQSAFATLLKVAHHKSTCIICFERCADFCHRSIIADYAVTEGFDVYNLLPDQAEKYFLNDYPIPRHYSRQSISAAE